MGNLTTLGAWSLGTLPDGITCTIGAATGILNITALSVTEALVPVTFTYGSGPNAIVRSANVRVQRQKDQVTNSGSSGGGAATGFASTTTVGPTNGTSYDLATAVSETLKVKTGASGQVSLATGALGFIRGDDSVIGVNGAAGKWQWRAIGGSWADVGTEVASTISSRTRAGTVDDPALITTVGSMNVAQTKTGMTANTDYEFRFVWRRTDGSGSPSNVYVADGTLTATAS